MFTVFVVAPGSPPGAVAARGSEQRMVGDDGRRHPDHKAGAADADRKRRQPQVPARERGRQQSQQQGCGNQADRAGMRCRPGSRRLRGRQAGPLRHRPGALGSRAGRSPAHRCPAGPRGRAVGPPPRQARPRTPRWPRLEIERFRRQLSRLRRLRLGSHRPVDHQAEIDDRDLQDQHHEDELPDHRGSIRDAVPGPRGATGRRPSRSARRDLRRGRARAARAAARRLEQEPDEPDRDDHDQDSAPVTRQTSSHRYRRHRGPRCPRGGTCGGSTT